MKAAVCRAFGAPLTVEDVTLAPPHHGEIRVKLRACAICHSDLTFAEGGWGGALPAVYGHEGAGVVVETGAGVSDFAVGDPVVVTLIRSCGCCRPCTTGHHVVCEGDFRLDHETPLSDRDGQPLVHGMRSGAFAEEVVVEASQAVKIPASLPFDVASLLACGVITGFCAVTNTAKVPPGASVAVIGLGGVGMNAVQAARISGASAIVALDLAPEKVALAHEFGATHAVVASSPDAAEQVRAATGGRGADFVFVCVGANRALEGASAMLAPGGAVVVVGMPASGVLTTFEAASLAAHDQRIIGSKMGGARVRVDIPYLVSLYQQGRLKLDELITGRYSLDRINEAMASVYDGNTVKNVVVFDA